MRHNGQSLGEGTYTIVYASILIDCTEVGPLGLKCLALIISL